MADSKTAWVAGCADRCIDAIRQKGYEDVWRHYANVAHQLMQCSPEELRAFVESYPLDRSLSLAPLMVLAWRIVGNEFRTELAQRASERIALLCDLDEWENAVEAFAGPVNG